MNNGIIKKVDDLGRIVIPKNIRKKLRIKNGDNLEIIIDNEDIVLKKYSMISKINDLAKELVESISIFMKHSIFITDTDNIIACTSSLKGKYLNKHISKELEESIMRREKMFQNHFKLFQLIDEESITCSYVSCVILSGGESVGMIIILSETEKMTETELQMASIVSSFITKYLEQ